MSSMLLTSVEGIHRAERELEAAAGRIARGVVRQAPKPADENTDSVRVSSQQNPAAAPSVEPQVDYATELLAVLRARTAVKANLRALSHARDVEDEVLDLLR